MTVFLHHLYEYKKGLRNLILHTTASTFSQQMVNKLHREGIDYFILPVNEDKINIFFGAKECVDVVRSIEKDCLSCFSAEEDFILGIMLGYDRLKQCRRYLKMKQRHSIETLLS
jgi:hypothetical protein